MDTTMSDAPKNKLETKTETRADFYKETVFLPRTDFPMRGDLPTKEPMILKKWQEDHLYKTQRQQSKGKPKWILHWGPPYANGRAHIGHAFTKSLKDVVNRTMQMMGYDAPLVPGWDCHGLPIEWKIEEKYREQGLNKDDVPVLQFRNECRDFAKHWVDVQSQDFQRLGVFADWDHPYLTMTSKAEATIVREIHKFLLNDGLYLGVKPVMWSVVEKTALAEAEVEYKEHKSITCWVQFPVKTAPDPILMGASVVIWTTTPWTLPSNRALAAGATIDYALYQISAVDEKSKAKLGDKILLAKNLLEDVKKNAGLLEVQELKSFKGSDLQGLVCQHPLHGLDPFYDFESPLLFGDFVTDDAGTGFVHISPSHGEDDYHLYVAHFGARNIADNVADDGRFRDHVALFAGLYVYNEKGQLGDGNFAVLKSLDQAGHLMAKGSMRHDYPHSWRSKAPIIFRTTPQWFISMDTNNLREKSLAAIEKTKWIPASGENRIKSMVANRPDWCISRQRAWGVPIALFIHKDSKEILKDPDVLNRIFATFEAEGSDAWYQRPAQYFLGDHYKSEDYTQVFDIVDVWFESGSTHAFVLEQFPDLRSPADLYLEGSDQHRGWFHSSLLESCGTRGVAPYKSVLTHGFVLDDKGYKMSKSLGNVVDPHDVMKEYGADILRLWAITSDYGEDIRIGKDNLKLAGDLYRRIRNTLRFVLGALDGFTESEKLDLFDETVLRALPELDQLMLHRLKALDAELRGYIEAYDFSKLANRLHHVCTLDLSAQYFDIRKDRLYCDRPDTFERRAHRTVLLHIFEFLTAWFAPILPFTTEETWGFRPAGLGLDSPSIHLRQFPDLPSVWLNEALDQKWQNLWDLRRVVLGALEIKRADKTIGSSLEAAPKIYLTPDMQEKIVGVDVAELTITSSVSFSTDAPPADAFRLNDVSNIAVIVELAHGKKCQRCWKILPEVGTDKEYPDLSLRDADAVRFFMQHKKAA
jgi:isoleucyl-tRNA synthetase